MLFTGYENESDFKSRLGYDESYGGVKSILDCFISRDTDTLEESYGITEEQLGSFIYRDFNGNEVGLTQDDVITGVGRIEIDGDYDTTYTKYLSDLDAAEIRAIIKSIYWQQEEVYIALLDLHGYEVTENEDEQWVATNETDRWESEPFETEEEARENAIQDLCATL